MPRIPAKIYLHIFVIFANFWIWKIFEEDLILGAVLVLLSLALFFLSNLKFNRKFLVLVLLLIAFISSRILMNGFDKDLIVLSGDQQKSIGDRHGYFSIELGKLFQNKFTLRFYKDIYPYVNVYEGNLFNALSPNLYFFSNHPREREKIGEFVIYPSILIFPFFIGLLRLIKSSNKILVWFLFFVTLTTGLVKQNYFFGPILFFPFINILITNGLVAIYGELKNEK